MLLNDIFNQTNPKQLDEKLIVVNKGKLYGQIVFLAGGAGSGKGFAINKFLEGNKFKIRDVDAWKQAYLKLNSIKNMYPELSGLDLGNPDDVFKMHMFIKERKIKEKTLDLILKDKEEQKLPNIIFDITAKSPSDIVGTLPILFESGYEPKNIHLIWVLTNYNIAMERNLSRARKVPVDVFLQTHSGAALTMSGILKGAYPYLNAQEVNGEVHVILNNNEEIKYWKDKNDVMVTTKPKNGDKPIKIIKDFSSLKLKDSGKKPSTDKKLHDKLYQWMIENVPPDVAKEIKRGSWPGEKTPDMEVELQPAFA